MPVVASMTEWLSSYREIYQEDTVWEGFVSGLAVGFVLPVGILLVVLLVLYRRRRCRGIRVPGEGGDLFISATAVREFLQRLIAEFSELELLSVQLRRRRALTDIVIRVNAVPGSNVNALKDALKERVRSEASDKLALDDLLGDIHVDVQKLSASERVIAKKARKAHAGEAPLLPTSPGGQSTEETDQAATGLGEPLPVSQHHAE